MVIKQGTYLGAKETCQQPLVWRAAVLQISNLSQSMEVGVHCAVIGLTETCNYYFIVQMALFVYRYPGVARGSGSHRRGHKVSSQRGGELWRRQKTYSKVFKLMQKKSDMKQSDGTTNRIWAHPDRCMAVPWSAHGAPPPGNVPWPHWWRARSAAACGCIEPPWDSNCPLPDQRIYCTLGSNRKGWSACFCAGASAQWWGPRPRC